MKIARVLTCQESFVILDDVPCAEIYILKVGVRKAVLSTRSRSHANSHRICVVKTQKDSSGCGACRMATVYCTVESSDSKSKSRQCRDLQKNKENTPRHRGVFLLFIGII